MSKLLTILLGLLAFAILCWFCINQHLPEIMAKQGINPTTAVPDSSKENTNANLNTNAGSILANFNGESKEGKFVVSGIVPSDDIKKQLLDKAKEVHGADNVVDEIKVDAKVSNPSWLKGVLASLPFTKGLENAGLKVEEKSISLIGVVADEATKTKLGQDAAKAVGADVLINNLLTIKGAEMSAEDSKTQVQINEALTGKIVEFNTNSDQLTDRGKAVLDELVKTFEQNKDTKFEIAGHTDSDGDDTKNQILSENRAKTVRVYLVEKGLSADNFSTVGFGEKRPIADNTTAEGKQRNRRIEFNVMGGEK